MVYPDNTDLIEDDFYILPDPVETLKRELCPLLEYLEMNVIQGEAMNYHHIMLETRKARQLFAAVKEVIT